MLLFENQFKHINGKLQIIIANLFSRQVTHSSFFLNNWIHAAISDCISCNKSDYKSNKNMAMKYNLFILPVMNAECVLYCMPGIIRVRYFFFLNISWRWPCNWNPWQRWQSGDGVAQWVARQTRDRWMPVSREFEPHQRPPLFPWAKNFTLIA